MSYEYVRNIHFPSPAKVIITLIDIPKGHPQAKVCFDPERVYLLLNSKYIEVYNKEYRSFLGEAKITKKLLRLLFRQDLSFLGMFPSRVIPEHGERP